MAKKEAPSILAWITLIDASRESGCHYTYLQRVVKHGAIASRKVGGRVLLSRESFDKWNAGYQENRRLSVPHGFLAESAAVSK